MFLSASVENTPKLSNLFLFSVNAGGHPLCLQSLHFSIQLPTQIPSDTWKAAGSSAQPKPLFSYRYLFIATNSGCLAASHHLLHVKDLTTKTDKTKSGKKEYCPCFSGRNYCPDSLINASEVVWGVCSELWTAVRVRASPLSFLHSWDSHGVDVTELCTNSVTSLWTEKLLKAL